MNWLEILAQNTPPTSQPAPDWYRMLVQLGPILLIIVVFYFFIFGSKRKTEKRREDMLKQLKKNDRIQTIGGILGTVLEVRDNEVLVKVDETSNTKMRFTRSAIHRVIEEEKAQSK